MLFIFLAIFSANEVLLSAQPEVAVDPWRARVIQLIQKSQKSPSCATLSDLPPACLSEMNQMELVIKSLNDSLKKATYHGWLQALTERFNQSKIVDAEFRKRCANREGFDQNKKLAIEASYMQISNACRNKIQTLRISVLPKLGNEKVESQSAFKDIMKATTPPTTSTTGSVTN